VKEHGAFIKSIGFENFEIASQMSKLMKCHSIYAVSCSDNHIHVYTQNSNLIRYFGAFYSGRVAQQKLWYLKLHKTWISCGKDLQLRKFNFSSKTKLRLTSPLKFHTDEISDVVEVEFP
jgi:hypothetical protein